MLVFQSTRAPEDARDLKQGDNPMTVRAFQSTRAPEDARDHNPGPPLYWAKEFQSTRAPEDARDTAATSPPCWRRRFNPRARPKTRATRPHGHRDHGRWVSIHARARRRARPGSLAWIARNREFQSTRAPEDARDLGFRV